MAITATISDALVEPDVFQIQPETKKIEALSLDSEGQAADLLFNLSYPFDLVPEFDGADYYVALFGHALWPQSDVFTLRLDGVEPPVGALFSIEVLSTGFVWQSDESDRRKWIMEQYAAIALLKLCKEEVRGFSLSGVVVAEEAPVPISRFYHPDTVIAIFRRDLFFTQAVNDQNDSSAYSDFLLNYLPTFYENGLFPAPWAVTGTNPASPPGKYRALHNRLDRSGAERNLTLKPFSPHLTAGQREYLLTVFQKIDPIETSAFFRFFLYYQMFELWMQDVYEKNIVLFRAAIHDAENEDTSLFREKIQSLTTALKESNRLSEVLAANSVPGTGQGVFLDCCNEVLTACGQQLKTDASEAFYRVRNRLVHSFNQAKAAEREFEKLADVTLEVICFIATSYVPSTRSLF